MLQKVVVVVLPSPYKPVACWRCHKTIESLSPFCPECQVLQDLPLQGINHFSVLGYPPSLHLPENELREKYYALSQKTHPDRFVNVPPPEPLYAGRWSSAINKAYQTLKEDKKRTEYLLDLFQIKPKSNQVPVELAESYFELQDLLLEEEGEERMREFKNSLLQQIEATSVEWKAIAKDWELGAEQEGLLARLSALTNKQSYLYSMLSDIERRMGGTSGNRWN